MAGEGPSESLESMLQVRDAFVDALDPRRPWDAAIAATLAAVRGHLGLDAVVVAEWRDGELLARWADGPLGDDVAALQHVPIALSDGQVFGMLCARPAPPADELDARDRRFLTVVAQLIAGQLEREHARVHEVATATDRVRQLLDDGAPAIVLQPIVELDAGRPVGYEALSRFPAEPGRPPERWFDQAAATGLGDELELAAVRAALANLDTVPEPAYLAINVSPEVVASPAFAEALEGVRLDRIVLEITEHARVEDYEALRAALARPRSQGMRVAIDDAGAGYASMLHVLKLEPDIIKLDVGLTRRIDTDPLRRALATSLVAFAADLGGTIVAEGIEDEREARALAELGVPYGQGYLFGRPRSALPGEPDAPEATDPPT